MSTLQARLACTTAWIASPAETVALLDEIEIFSIESNHTGKNNDDGVISKQKSRPDTSSSADAIARDLINVETPPSKVDDESTFNKVDTPASTYDADPVRSTNDDATSTHTAVPQDNSSSVSVSGIGNGSAHDKDSSTSPTPLTINPTHQLI